MATLFLCVGLYLGSNIVQRANSIRPYTAYYQCRVIIYPTIVILAHPLIPSILVQIPSPPIISLLPYFFQSNMA